MVDCFFTPAPPWCVTSLANRESEQSYPCVMSVLALQSALTNALIYQTKRLIVTLMLGLWSESNSPTVHKLREHPA